MEIGIGLPGTRGSLVLDWARRTDSGPFSSRGIIDRLVYTNYEPLVTLAAARRLPLLRPRPERRSRGRLPTRLLRLFRRGRR